MTKITYGDKTAVDPQISHGTQWWADDANEVKDTINENDTVDTSTSATIVFDQVTGYRHGTWGTPITGTITLDDATAVEGACAVMIWSGSSTPTFSGGTIESMSGEITESGTYSIYFHYLNGRININVFNVSGSVDVTAPVLLSATIEDADPTDLVMVFSEAVTGTNLGFTIAGTTSTSFSSISGSGTTTITGVLGTSAANGETITLDYSSITGDIEDSSGNVLASFTGTSVTNNIASFIYVADFSGLSVGNYSDNDITGVLVEQGTPAVVDDGGSKIKSTGTAGTSDVLDLGDDMSDITSETGIEIILENVKFNYWEVDGYLFGTIGQAGENGIAVQLRAVGEIDMMIKYGGVNDLYAMTVTGLVTGTEYSSLKFTFENEGAKLRLRMFIEGVEHGSGYLTTPDVAVADLYNPRNWYLFARNVADAVSGDVVGMQLSRFYINAI